MGQTIFITGTSSGIGQATVLYFAEQGWNVAATLRAPEKQSGFAHYPNIKTYQLDVTDTPSITTAVAKAIEDFGQIEVLVNNAGVSVFGAFECATENEIQQQLNTNLLGVMNVTRAVLPHFRQRKQGRLITVTSVGGLVAFPLFTLYHASKWAVEGFMESLHYELRQFNIKVKIVEPGAVNTHLTANTVISNNSTIEDYDQYAELSNFITAAEQKTQQIFAQNNAEFKLLLRFTIYPKDTYKVEIATQGDVANTALQTLHDELQTLPPIYTKTDPIVFQVAFTVKANK